MGTTGTRSPTKEDGKSDVDYDSHRLYRRIAGKLLWLVPIRPDKSYLPKELSQTLHPHTFDDNDNEELRHAIRYLNEGN